MLHCVDNVSSISNYNGVPSSQHRHSDLGTPFGGQPLTPDAPCTGPIPPLYESANFVGSFTHFSTPSSHLSQGPSPVDQGFPPVSLDPEQFTDDHQVSWDDPRHPSPPSLSSVSSLACSSADTPATPVTPEPVPDILDFDAWYAWFTRKPDSKARSASSTHCSNANGWNAADPVHGGRVNGADAYHLSDLATHAPVLGDLSNNRAGFQWANDTLNSNIAYLTQLPQRPSGPLM